MKNLFSWRRWGLVLVLQDLRGALYLLLTVRRLIREDERWDKLALHFDLLHLRLYVPVWVTPELYARYWLNDVGKQQLTVQVMHQHTDLTNLLTDVRLITMVSPSLKPMARSNEPVFQPVTKQQVNTFLVLSYFTRKLTWWWLFRWTVFLWGGWYLWTTYGTWLRSLLPVGW